MAKQDQAKKQAEAFVRKVLIKSFGQKVDAETLRAFAAKVHQVVTPAAHKKIAA